MGWRVRGHREIIADFELRIANLKARSENSESRIKVQKTNTSSPVATGY
jgi:hypothetical protein